MWVGLVTIWPNLSRVRNLQSGEVFNVISIYNTGRPLGFHQISTTKKKTKYGPNYLKYRPHSTISTKYRLQKFLKKRVFTLFWFLKNYFWFLKNYFGYLKLFWFLKNYFWFLKNYFGSLKTILVP